MAKWKKTGGISNNVILEGEGFFISYASADGLSILGVMAGSGTGETALCIEEEYFILDGDFRKEYEKIIDQGVGVCKKFFNKNKNGSAWSD